MNQKSVTSMQRVLTTLGHREPDRVPFFLLATLHGAKEVGLPIKTYFSDPDNVVEGQMRLLAKYRHDCIYSFFYAPVEIAAFGGEVVFTDDGPPNSGEPVIKKTGDIKNLAVPDVKNTPCLEKVLTAKDRYLNLTLSMAGVCGLAMENARRYQKIKDTENKLRNEKEKLEAALAEVKKLSGLIPICSHCKKVRDDTGYWSQVEAYIQEHSEAKFSHGICRECAEKYYPGYNLYEDE
jgi:uroporphyrinogen-III decarboxylase